MRCTTTFPYSSCIRVTLPKHLLGASSARSLTLRYFIKLGGACLVGQLVGSFAVAISVSFSLSHFPLLARCWIRETTGNFRFYHHFIIHDIVLSLGCNAGLVSYRRRRVKRVSSFVVLVLLAGPCTRLARSCASRLKHSYKSRTLLLVTRESWIDDIRIRRRTLQAHFTAP